VPFRSRVFFFFFFFHHIKIYCLHGGFVFAKTAIHLGLFDFGTLLCLQTFSASFN